MTRRVRAGLVGCVVAGALVLAGCTGGGGDGTGSGTNFVSGSGTTEYAVGDRVAAPAVSGTTLQGKPLNVAQYRGKVVVLNFWGSWCAPCRVEGPVLQTLSTDLAAKGVQFVGVDVREDADAARAYTENNALTYPSLSDPDNQIALRFNGLVPAQAFPSTIVLDRDGKIAARIIGPTTQPRLQALLAPIAAERA